MRFGIRRDYSSVRKNPPIQALAKWGEFKNEIQGTIRDYARKDVIFGQEELLDSAGIILYGNVLLFKENIAESRFIFSELGSGDILGETALRLEQEPSGYEAVAGSDCRSLFIRINRIIRPGRQTCQLRARIIENMMVLLAAEELSRMKL
ncbi:cyclic nucleotide-binding domain-containing protein [Paenibacillus sp. FSL R7-0345]|uniref:cyclic nucleotide-binding domain-containing protein n=1 Tax=Paenibacillus sp. FSL R7-0345 TaxID=2954535 RepID=UPI00315B147D